MANVAWKVGAWGGNAWAGTVWYADASGKAWWTDAWVAGAWYGTAFAANAGSTVDYSIAALQGSIALTGQAVGFGIIMPAETGLYTYTGDPNTYRDILLQTVPIVDDDFALTGQDATLRYGRFITAETGYYDLFGQNVSNTSGINMAAQFEHYAVTMQNVSFTFGKGLFVSGTFALTGQDANLRVGYRLIAETGTYAYTGTEGDMVFGNFIDCDTGLYTLTGQTFLSPRGYNLSAVTGYYDSNLGQARNPPIIDHPDSRHLPAGGVGKKKRKEEPRKRVIEIDGEEFVVESEDEARVILESVKELAALKAQEDGAAEVVRRLKAKAAAIDTTPVDLSIPKILSNDEAFQAQVSKIVEDAYRRAGVEAELAVRLAKQRLIDEEDNLVLLLLNQ